MKKELKEKVVKEAKKLHGSGSTVHFADGQNIASTKVLIAPDAYWVQAWIKVPLDDVKS